jgi:diacylglycerol O-acyltransferase
MAHFAYERLTALDNSFLVMEDITPNAPMHVASAGIYEAGPLRTADGGIDMERITRHIISLMHRIPRYRQRLMYVPYLAQPVWVDDHRFNARYHLRHTALAAPGDDRQLKRLCGRIFSQALDRGKPLWETWIVEGLPGDRFCMISKTHHCMIDGMSGVDLATVIMSTDPDAPSEEPVRWIPRPHPRPAELVRSELVHRLGGPLEKVSRLVREPSQFLSDFREGLSAVRETLGEQFSLASGTPFNEPIGPHRRFDWTNTPIEVISGIRQRLGGTLNDVVLATVAGGVRRFLELRGTTNVRDLRFRAMCPVSVRSESERHTLGNRVASWLVDLPIAEPDPRKRLADIAEKTAKLKESHQAEGGEILAEVLDWSGPTALNLMSRLATQTTSFNLVVTNVPGPRAPLYLLGARMLEAYGMVPLFENHGLGVALFSNAGKLFWGFNADWDAFPDLHDFAKAIDESFAELRAAEPLSSDAKRGRRGRNGDARSLNHHVAQAG